MYMPAHFDKRELGALHDAIDAAPLGALVAMGAAGLEANHVPFELQRERGAFGTLLCHVARANDLWRVAQAASSGAARLDALVIFQGPSAYVSPNWYPSKAQTHKVVPTYNYIAVHAHGRIVVHDDAQWLRGLLARLTRRFEAAASPEPWKMGDAPREFIDEQLRHIVGIEIEVTRLEGKWKMSQNRPAEDRAGVMANLRAAGGEVGRAVADAIALEEGPSRKP
jgi:transcriptional regulator